MMVFEILKYAPKLKSVVVFLKTIHIVIVEYRAIYDLFFYLCFSDISVKTATVLASAGYAGGRLIGSKTLRI